jgi:predicted dehydrogenase
MTHGSHLWDTIRYVIGDVASVQARWSQVGFAAAVAAAEGNGPGDVDGIWGAGGTVEDGLAAVRLLEATRDSAAASEEVRF